MSGLTKKASVRTRSQLRQELFMGAWGSPQQARFYQKFRNGIYGKICLWLPTGIACQYNRKFLITNLPLRLAFFEYRKYNVKCLKYAYGLYAA